MTDPTEHFQRQWEDMDPMTAEINRLRDANAEMRAVLADLIQGARRDRSLLIHRRSDFHLIDTQVTKGQVLRAINCLREVDA